MTKYISIETTNSGVLLFPTIQFFIPTLVDSNLIVIGPGDGLPLSCVNANQQLIDNINNAIISSAQGSYTDVVFPVTIPNGVEVLGLDFGGGGAALCEYTITVSSADPIFSVDFFYTDEFGNPTSVNVLNDGNPSGPYVAECGTMQIDPMSLINPADVTIDEVPL